MEHSITLRVSGEGDTQGIVDAITRFFFALDSQPMKGEGVTFEMRVNGSLVTRPERVRVPETYEQTMDRLRKREGLS